MSAVVRREGDRCAAVSAPTWAVVSAANLRAWSGRRPALSVPRLGDLRGGQARRPGSVVSASPSGRTSALFSWVDDSDVDLAGGQRAAGRSVEISELIWVGGDRESICAVTSARAGLGRRSAHGISSEVSAAISWPVAERAGCRWVAVSAASLVQCCTRWRPAASRQRGHLGSRECGELASWSRASRLSVAVRWGDLRRWSGAATWAVVERGQVWSEVRQRSAGSARSTGRRLEAVDSARQVGRWSATRSGRTSDQRLDLRRWSATRRPGPWSARRSQVRGQRGDAARSPSAAACRRC